MLLELGMDASSTANWIIGSLIMDERRRGDWSVCLTS